MSKKLEKLKKEEETLFLFSHRMIDYIENTQVPRKPTRDD